MNRPMVLITQSGVATVPAWWELMYVKDREIILEGDPEPGLLHIVVVAELDSAAEAGALFKLINERISSGTNRLDVRRISDGSRPRRRTKSRR